jgi:hypothetical protein
MNALRWITIGGLSFWLPVIILGTVLRQDEDHLFTLNVVPLAGVALLGAVSWISTKNLPRWGWVLAGIYTLGPISMLSPSIIHSIIHPTASVPGMPIWLWVLLLLPPVTLWMSLLNGLIFSVLIATVVLPFLPRRRDSSPPAG